MFLPPNVTSLIQPMDQNVFKIIKLHYRNTLLASIAANDSDLLESIKQITLKEAICHLERAWNRITSDLLHRCWKNILNFATVLDDCEENIPLAVLKENWDREARQLEESAAELLNILFPQVIKKTLNVHHNFTQFYFRLTAQLKLSRNGITTLMNVPLNVMFLK